MGWIVLTGIVIAVVMMGISEEQKRRAGLADSQAYYERYMAAQREACDRENEWLREIWESGRRGPDDPIPKLPQVGEATLALLRSQSICTAEDVLKQRQHLEFLRGIGPARAAILVEWAMGDWHPGRS